MPAISPRTEATSARGSAVVTRSEATSERHKTPDVVQHDVGKLTEWLVCVKAGGGRSVIGDVSYNADDCQPGILVLRHIRAPLQALAERVTPWPEPLRQSAG